MVSRANYFFFNLLSRIPINPFMFWKKLPEEKKDCNLNDKNKYKIIEKLPDNPQLSILIIYRETS